MSTKDYQTPDDDDDLPMTVRKARQERASQLGTAAAPSSRQHTPQSSHTLGYAGPVAATDGYDAQAYGEPAYDDRVTVTRFDVPFFGLVGFFLKAVLAAIPALILLGAILYGAGVVLRTYFPWIVQTEILIRFPN